MFERIARHALLGVLLVFPAVACDDVDGVGDGEAQVSVLLTDAPGDFQSATVTITQIYLQPDEGEDEEAERVILFEGETTVDLLDLTNEALALVEDEVVPAGTYGQLRMVISGGCIVVEQEGGSTRTFASQGYTACGEADGRLQMPSFAQSGLKVNLPGGAVTVTDDTEVLLVDFDVSQSFGKQAGQSGMWVMRPVVTATKFELAAAVQVNLGLASGVTLPSVTVNGQTQAVTLGMFKARLTNAAGSTEEVPLEVSAAGTATGTFRFLVPAAGPFKVEIVGPAGVTFTVDPAAIQNLDVGAGQTTTVSFTITAASAS